MTIAADFYPVPGWALALTSTERPKGQRLSPLGVLLLGVIAYYDRTGAGAYPSMKTLAKLLEVDQRTIRALVAKAEQLGVLEVASGLGRGNLTTYRLRHPDAVGSQKEDPSILFPGGKEDRSILLSSQDEGGSVDPPFGGKEDPPRTKRGSAPDLAPLSEEESLREEITHGGARASPETLARPSRADADAGPPVAWVEHAGRRRGELGGPSGSQTDAARKVALAAIDAARLERLGRDPEPERHGRAVDRVAMAIASVALWGGELDRDVARRFARKALDNGATTIAEMARSPMRYAEPDVWPPLAPLAAARDEGAEARATG